MNDISFTHTALKDYMQWQTEDHKTLKKINALIEDILRNGLMKGIGKPEVLKHMKAYSRRIDDVNRLVYTADENKICLSCPAKVITNNPYPASLTSTIIPAHPLPTQFRCR
jgi:toxin YoeB